MDEEFALAEEVEVVGGGFEVVDAAGAHLLVEDGALESPHQHQLHQGMSLQPSHLQETSAVHSDHFALALQRFQVE